jgi:predicted N-acetyltransferase YhbS
MQTREIEFVPFRPEHIESAVALSRAENWPHRPEDWQMALQLSQGVVALDETGHVVGTILVTPYGDDCAMINMVIVAKEMRGHGLGRKLMERAFALADSRPLRLVATADGLPLYEKQGFVACDTILQHQGNVIAVVGSAKATPATNDDLAAIKRLDRDAYGANRAALIDAIAERGELAVIRSEGAISGYAAIRKFGRGEVIGPVVATSVEDAKALITFFAATRPGAYLRVDTGQETAIAAWLSEIGLAHVGGGIAMRNPLTRSVEKAQSKIYALANQALG